MSPPLPLLGAGPILPLLNREQQLSPHPWGTSTCRSSECQAHTPPEAELPWKNTLETLVLGRTAPCGAFSLRSSQWLWGLENLFQQREVIHWWWQISRLTHGWFPLAQSSEETVSAGEQKASSLSAGEGNPGTITPLGCGRFVEEGTS